MGFCTSRESFLPPPPHCRRLHHLLPPYPPSHFVAPPPLLSVTSGRSPFARPLARGGSTPQRP